jgi:hypothetical protein
LAEEQGGVVGVVAVVPGPPRTEHSRHPVESFNLESGVIGHGGQAGGGERIARLGQRVLLERRSRLRGLVERRHLVECNQCQPGQPRGVKHAAQFGQLLAIAASDQ